MGKFDFKQMDREIRTSALQRKEENQIFFSTHLQGLVGGESVAGEVYDEESEEVENGFFTFAGDEYKFATFSELTFGCAEAGNSSQLMRVGDIVFYYCDFSMCGFSNIHFERCAFVGCNFKECYTLGFAAVFEECRFMSRTAGGTEIDDAPSMFSGCELSVKLIRTDLQMTVFEKSHFYFTKFVKTNLNGAIFLDCSFDIATVSDSDMRSTKFLNPKFIDFHIEDSLQRTKVNKNTYLSKISFAKKEEREVRFAADVYSQFSELFENGKLMDLSGEYFYLYKKTESLNLKGLAKIKAIIGNITCGYGERPFFSLFTSLALVLICGTLYMFFGVNANNEIMVFRPSLQHPLPSFKELVIWYHFSLVTFSTVGYGNVVPIGYSLLVSAIEMVLGIIMVGIWVSTLVRKMVR